MRERELRRTRYLGQACSEKDALEQLSHLLKELVDVRTLQNVHLVDGTVNFNRHDKVSVVDRLK